MSDDPLVPREDSYARLRQFADIKAPPAFQAFVERSYDVLAGTLDPNHLRQLVVDDLAGQPFFINDNCWWFTIDPQCTCLGVFGWEPFLPDRLRRVVRRSLSEFFADQADGRRCEPGSSHVVPDGAFPSSVTPSFPLRPERWLTYYGNWFSNDPATQHPDHDEIVDFQLFHVIDTLDWLLWEGDTATANLMLPALERWLRYVDAKPHHGEALRLGVQGSQLEFAHGGPRYTTGTQFYLLRVYQGLASLSALLGRGKEAGALGERAARLASQTDDFLAPGGWYASARTADYGSLMGNGALDGSASSYFEVFPNAAPSFFGLVSRARSQTIARRFLDIPQLSENHLGLYNYPARPPEEMDDNAAFPAAGNHVNGGWFWMTAGLSAALLIHARHPRAFALSAELLIDHDARSTVDYYADWGRAKESQWPDKRPAFGGTERASITCAGAWGNILRTVLGLDVTARSLIVGPNLPPEIESLETLAPIRVRGCEVRLKIENHGANAVTRASLDGKDLPLSDSPSVEVPIGELSGQSVVSLWL